ncbi:MAG: PAS domain-containing protein [Candidatus Dormibacteraeota bacterium]|nr:PAS domain-containing protein [Candidatus Dormibacteraeota bacterium]
MSRSPTLRASEASAARPHRGPLDSHTAPVDFREVAESIPHIVWVADPDGATRYINRQGTTYAGAEACGGGRVRCISWTKLVHPDDARWTRTAWSEATRAAAPYQADLRLRRRDGKYRWHSCRALPHRDAAGNVDVWIGTATDIEHQKSSERSLIEAQRHAHEAASILETLQANAPVGFGFVDRMYRFVHINQMLADINGRSIAQHIGRTVAEVVPDMWAQIEPLYRRILTGGEAAVGQEMSGETAADPGQTHHWLVNLYPVLIGAQIIGLGIVVVDISERKLAEEARQQVSRAAVDAMAACVEARDPYTAGHQRRVADIAADIAREMSLAPFDIEGIHLAASIHDIGKIRVPAEILARPGRLTPAEFELVKSHCVAGYEIVQGIAFPWPVADMVRQHHERFDGGGYPERLKRREIVVGARIISVADVCEAMCAHRPYRPGLGLDQALDEIRGGRGTQFDPEAVDALMILGDSGRLPCLQRLPQLVA